MFFENGILFARGDGFRYRVSVVFISLSCRGRDRPYTGAVILCNTRNYVAQPDTGTPVQPSEQAKLFVCNDKAETFKTASTLVGAKLDWYTGTLRRGHADPAKADEVLRLTHLVLKGLIKTAGRRQLNG